MFSDLNALLEKIPVWKRLVAMPAELAALTERVALLESKLGQPLSKDACPSCGERAFFLESSRKVGPTVNRTQECIYKCRACQKTVRRTEKT